MEETKIIYHIDDEATPYLVKLPIAPERVTLCDFKNVLNRPNYKFFFKSMDDDFGYVYFYFNLPIIDNYLRVLTKARNSRYFIALPTPSHAFPEVTAWLIMARAKVVTKLIDPLVLLTSMSSIRISLQT